MNRVQKMLQAIDRFQQRHRWLAFAVASWKKFSDDHAGNLAALLAYYAFVAIFPLLLVLVTVLSIVLSNDPELQQRVLDSALANYPVIGDQLKQHVHALSSTGIALVVGLIFTFLGARGVAGAAQNALNTAWGVPFAARPGFPWDLIRSVSLILVVGIGQIITVILSGLAGGTAHVITGLGGHIATIAASLLLNMGLFWAGFRLATAGQIATRDLRLGAFIAAGAWQVLQLAGTYIVGRNLAHSSALYGVFGLVLGLLAWLYLQAQITLYAVELNVVKMRKLWPRSLFPPPLTPQDVAAYRLYAQAEQRRPELDIVVRETQKAGKAPDVREAKEEQEARKEREARDADP